MYYAYAKLKYFAIVWVFLLGACGGGGGDGSNQSADSADDGDKKATSQQENNDDSHDFLSEKNIMDAIYQNKRMPAGFYSEPDPDPGVFQTIHHIDNIEITPLDERTAGMPRYPVCADHYDQALNWSIETGDDLGDLVDVSETGLFFQFSRVPTGQPSLLNLQRVYKCAVFDRSLVDLNNPDDHIGFYNALPQRMEQVKTIVEYVWTFGIYNNYGNAVLSSEIEDTGGAFRHALYQARLTPGGDCDRIDVYRTDYRTSKDSGNILYGETRIDQFQARYENGVATVCN